MAAMLPAGADAPAASPRCRPGAWWGCAAIQAGSRGGEQSHRWACPGWAGARTQQTGAGSLCCGVEAEDLKLLCAECLPS